MKKLTRILKKKRCGGFTLVEMIISMAVMALLMAGIMAIITPIVRSFNDTNRNIVAENISTCVQNYVTMSARNATSVMIFGNTNKQKIKENAIDKINILRNFCNTTTGDGKQAYRLKCINLKYDSADQRYYVYSGTIKTTGVTATTDPFEDYNEQLVFSKCLYQGLFTSYTFSNALDLDKSTDASPVYLRGTISTDVKTYSNSSYSTLIFSGSGLTEFREITRDYAIFKDKSKFSLKLYDGLDSHEVKTITTPIPSDGVADDQKDIFIFYAEYNFQT